MNELHRFPIRFDRWYEPLSCALLLPSESAYVEVSREEVSVQMGWAFRTRFTSGSVASIVKTQIRPLSRGVHGFAGRWLVNGSGDGIVTIELSPHQRGYVLGIPVFLKRLEVSVVDPEAVILALTR